MRYFSKDHEWAEIDGDIATIGITDYAQGQLGDIVYVELPAVGTDLKAGGEAAVVESVKAASELYAPLSGKVTEVNEALSDDPSLVNSAAESDGWVFRVQLSNPSEVEGLMDAVTYSALILTI